MNNYPGGLVLASASPRRSELLAGLAMQFQVVPADIDESVLPAELPDDYVLRMASEKATACLAGLEGVCVLGADTSVVCDGRILGKPDGKDDALEMLQLLSGRSHNVMSGVAVTDGERMAKEVSTTRVTFCDVPPQQALAYWETGEPADKAGAYGIQGLGAVFVNHIDGSYTGVVGLPLFETARLLRSFGFTVGI